MMEKIKIIAKDPMAICADDDDIEAGGMLAMMDKKKKKNKKKEKKSENEAQFLEDSFNMIGKLLSLCFGEAGAKIIGGNLDTESGDGDFDPLIPGERIMGIYGFCNILNFTDSIEVLNTEVMVFVN